MGQVFYRKIALPFIPPVSWHWKEPVPVFSKGRDSRCLPSYVVLRVGPDHVF